MLSSLFYSLETIGQTGSPLFLRGQRAEAELDLRLPDLEPSYPSDRVHCFIGRAEFVIPSASLDLQKHPAPVTLLSVEAALRSLATDLEQL